jgi:TPP-dependent pyruvate/acetoin dehydrogenase alpha subunit
MKNLIQYRSSRAGHHHNESPSRYQCLKTSVLPVLKDDPIHFYVGRLLILNIQVEDGAQKMEADNDKKCRDTYQ